MEETTAYCLGRVRGSEALADVPHVRDRVAEMHARYMTTHDAAYKAAWMLDHGQPCDPELMHAKRIGAQAVRQATDDALELHGAPGLAPDGDVVRHLLDARHMDAPAGPGAVQLLRIGQHALGRARGQFSQRFADLLTAA